MKMTSSVRASPRRWWMEAIVSNPVLLMVSFALISLPVEGRSVLGIDLGSEFMKVALVRSGSPLEIVTNQHSKRKTEQLVLFDQGQRFYGADANGLLQRKAQLTPCSMTEFLGRDLSHPNVQAFVDRHFPVTPKYNETRKGLTLTIPKAGEFTPEELVAMVLRHAVEISVEYAKSAGSTIPPPVDVVLTVPCYYTHVERKALLDAAHLAGLNVLTLLDVTTAAALHYAHDKNFENDQVFLFYNMGAVSLQVQIVRFYQYEQKQGFGKPKPVPALQVLAKSWDSTLGGLAWDHVLVEYLADEFNKLWRKASGDEKKDIRSIQRPMTKLFLAANKAKQVLSANSEYPVQLDGLHDDVSLRLTLTRQLFDDLMQPLLDRAVKPVLDVLARANMTVANLTGLELLGGGMRVPSVQSKLAEVLAPLELGLHMNSDESMALGAAFVGANISTAFRVRQVGMSDLTPFAQQITLANMEGGEEQQGGLGWFSKFRKTSEKKNTVEGDEEDWSKKAVLFSADSRLGVKKTIAFTHDKDVHCSLDYIDSEPPVPLADPKLERFEISGVAEFAKELKEDKKLEGKPKVTLQFELTQSGITALVKAEATMEENYTVEEEVEVDDGLDAGNATAGEAKRDQSKKGKEDKADQKKKKKKNGADAKSETTADNTTEKPSDNTTEKASDNTTSGNSTESSKESPKKKKTIKVQKEKKRVHRRTLKVSTYYEGKIQPHWDELFDASKAKLAAMDKRDKDRMLLEEAKNRVESYMFMVKNKLVDDEEELAKVSTEEQREVCRKLASDTEHWLEEEGYSANLATLEDKFVELSAPFDKILLRLKETTERPQMVKKMEEVLAQVEALLKTWETSMPQVTVEERQKVMDRISLVRANITALEELQASKAPHEDPVYVSTDLPPKLQPVEALVQRLAKKPKPKAPPVQKDKNNTNTTATNETSGANESTASETNKTTTDSENSTKGNESSSDGKGAGTTNTTADAEEVVKSDEL